MPPTRTRPRAIAVLTVAGSLAVAPAAFATGHYPTWSFTAGSTPASQSRQGNVEFGVPGFPTGADFITDKTVPDGKNTSIGNDASGPDVIAAGSVFGTVFGTSAGQDFLTTRIDASGLNNTSMVTYWFSRPLPPGAWAFSLGDIDVDRAYVSATGPGGAALTGAQLAGSASPVPYDSLVGQDPSMVLPTWIPSPGGGVESQLVGSTPGNETQGAAGWFRPSVPVSLLSIRFNGQPGSGTPSYRTWFALLAYPVTGTVTEQGTGTPVPHAVLTLEDPDGNVVGVAVTGPDGTYAMPEVYAQPGYTVVVKPPAGSTLVGQAQQVVSTATGPAVADFQVAKGTGGSGGTGGGGSSHVSSVVGYSEGDAAIVVTPGVQRVRPGEVVPFEITSTCTVSTRATFPSGLTVTSSPGATRSGGAVTWTGSATALTATVRVGRRAAGVKRVPVTTSCADGSTASATARLLVRGKRVSPAPVTG